MTSKTARAVITVNGLSKRYGQTLAVDNVALEVYESEVFGILGPNGAGKTTTLEMIEGLRESDDGSISVAGYDVRTDVERVKRKIGIQLQTTSLFSFLKVGELVTLFASLYGMDAAPEATSRVLDMVSLSEKADDLAENLSGGQQQRLSIALAMVNDPEILFLDEPTTGLDPQARRNLWDLVREIRTNGATIVLTTHYMEEAEALCDRVAVMDNGSIILCDTPERLIAGLDTVATISVMFGEPGPEESTLLDLPGVQSVEFDGARATLSTAELQQSMVGLVSLARDQGFELNELSTTRPTLEDVFLQYTGRALRE
jgi:ABC-2 type transport system ATP-binding protein